MSIAILREASSMWAFYSYFHSSLLFDQSAYCNKLPFVFYYCVPFESGYAHTALFCTTYVYKLDKKNLEDKKLQPLTDQKPLYSEYNVLKGDSFTHLIWVEKFVSFFFQPVG